MNYKLSELEPREKVFYGFVENLENIDSPDEQLNCGDQDIKYSFELQKRRLDNKNLKIKYKFDHGEISKGSRSDAHWSDERYICSLDYKDFKVERSFYRGEDRVYRKKQQAIIYESITDIKNKDVVGEDTYVCPNCGAISEIAKLQSGCPYCNTYFDMTDLFPKVTNYYFVNSYSMEGLKNKAIGSAVGGAAVSSLIMLFAGGPELWKYGTIIGMLSFIPSMIMGAFMGYFLFGIGLIVWALFNAGKTIPLLTNSAGSNKVFVNQMKKYSPEFSYEYFTSKVISILKMIIYSDNTDILPNYEGEDVTNMFADIVDTTYTGSLGLRYFKVEGDYCNVTVDAYMDNLYEKNGKIFKIRNGYRVYLRKNISIPMDLGFSIKKIQCDGCGDSFDATKQKNCPSCGRECNISEQDWVVTKIEKRN